MPDKAQQKNMQNVKQEAAPGSRSEYSAGKNAGGKLPHNSKKEGLGPNTKR